MTSQNQIKPGDTVYLKACEKLYDAYYGKWTSRERKGPFIVSSIYRTGLTRENHVRLSAYGSGFKKIDAAIDKFELV